MIHIGCLGAARIAPAALFHPAQIRGDVRLQGIAARERSRAEAFADKYDIAAVYEDYAALIADPNIDLIYNPLPINLHAHWTIKALEAGKHVLCEKPFAMNLAEAKRMVAAAEKADKRLIEAFHYRYHPVWEILLSWVQGGEIGDVHRLKAVFNVAIDDKGGTEIRHLPETGGGAFMDLGCYPLSWALMMIDGEPVKVSADAQLTARGVDEAMAAELTFPDGCRASLSASMAANEALKVVLDIEGTAGRITCHNPIAPHRGASIVLENARGRTMAPVQRTTTYHHQLGTILNALGTDTPLPTEGRMILRQQKWLDAIYAAAGLETLRQRSPAQ